GGKRHELRGLLPAFVFQVAATLAQGRRQGRLHDPPPSRCAEWTTQSKSPCVNCFTHRPDHRPCSALSAKAISLFPLEKCEKGLPLRKSRFTLERKGYDSGSACPMTRLMPGNWRRRARSTSSTLSCTAWTVNAGSTRQWKLTISPFGVSRTRTS